MIDQRRVLASRRLTGYVYKRTCKIVGYSSQELRMAVFNGQMSLRKCTEQKEVLDKEYVEQICRLSTSVLNEILQIHETGQLKRAPRTLDAIANELLERELHENKEAITKAK